MEADKYFDHWAGKKIWTHLNWPKHQERFRTIAAFLEGSRCVDIGCCFGHSTAILGGLYPAEWTGVDFSTRAILKAIEFFPNGHWIYCSDFQDLARLGRWDTVVCSEVMEHVAKDQELVDALFAITSKMLILTTPCVHVNDPGHLRVYDVHSLGRLLLGRQFTIQTKGQFFYVLGRP
jgi:2-polyprenyl-3-methyl-5-hydroxy-6-metoxy-1,4-benzoquinol methylase